MNTEQMIHRYFGATENPYEKFQENQFKLKIANAMKGDVVSFNGSKWDRIVNIRKTSEKDPIRHQNVFYIELESGKKIRRTGDVVVDSVEI